MSYENIEGPVITNRPPTPSVQALTAVLGALDNSPCDPDFPDVRQILHRMAPDELALLGIAADALRRLAYETYWRQKGGTPW